MYKCIRCSVCLQRWQQCSVFWWGLDVWDVVKDFIALGKKLCLLVWILMLLSYIKSRCGRGFPTIPFAVRTTQAKCFTVLCSFCTTLLHSDRGFTLLWFCRSFSQKLRGESEEEKYLLGTLHYLRCMHGPIEIRYDVDAQKLTVVHPPQLLFRNNIHLCYTFTATCRKII